MKYNHYYFPFLFNQLTPTDIQLSEKEQLQMQSGNIYMFPENLSNALALIQHAVSAENKDNAYYTYLAELAPNEEEKQIIIGIRNNEINHFNMFMQIYRDITGAKVLKPQDDQLVPPPTYCEGLKSAILGEQNAVQEYRQIFFAMQTRMHINMLTEIITDEIRHGILYNYLYAKNGCNV